MAAPWIAVKPLDLLRHRIPDVTLDLSAALDGKARWYLWQGKIGKATGKFWIPNLFDAAKLPAALDALKARHGIGTFEAAGRMEKSHEGVGNPQIGLVPWAFCEMDALARDEQDRRLAALADATGLEWALRVFSGNKSVQAYLSYATPLDPADPLRLAIQRLLIVCVEGDTKITDLNRLMRLPGYKGADRQQPVLSLSTATYDAADVRDRLVAYANTLGIADADAAYRALQVAEDLEHEAARGHDDADEMLRVARRLRDDRATVTVAEVADAVKKWKRTGGSGVAGAGGSFRGTGPTDTTWLPHAEWDALVVGLAEGDRCYPPCCVGYVRGTTGKFYGDSLRCHRCQRVYRPERAADVPDGVEDVTSVAEPVAPARPVEDLDDLTFSESASSAREAGKATAARVRKEVEDAARSAARRQDWEEVLRVALEAAEVTPLLHHLAERAAERKRAEARKVGRALEEEAEREAAGLPAALAAYADRLARKKEKAAEVPEEVRLGAEASLKFAGVILRRVLARREAQGLPGSRPKGSKPCGVPLALHNAIDGNVLGARICRDEDCPVHGPIHQARRIAAIARMPLVHEDEGDAPAVGLPLGSRSLHEYRFAASKVGNFKDAWGRSKVAPDFASNSAHPIYQEGGTRNSPQNTPVEGYVTFDVGNGEIVALTTRPLAIRTGGRGRPSALAGSYVGRIGAEDAEERVVVLGVESIRAVKPGLEDGLDLEPVVVTGTVTSSQTLHLDPEGTARVAKASPWLAVGEVQLAPLRDALKVAGLTVATREDESSPGEVERVSARAVAPETARAAVERAGGTPYGRRPVRPAAATVEPWAPVAEVDIDDLLTESA